jgi:hypothetical protein
MNGPDTKIVRLAGHPVLSETSSSVGQGGCMLAFGLPFVGAGGYLAWVLRFHPNQIDYGGPVMPMAFLYGFAALFVVSGLMLWLVAFRAIVNGLLFERRLRRHSEEPWLADRAWNPKGDRERPFSSAIQGLFGLGFLVLFLAPFHWWMWADTWIPGVFILALFDLLPLGALAYLLYSVGRAMKYGASWVGYDRFPFFLGETLEVRLGCRGRLDRFEKLTVTVRFIKVKQERSGSSNQTVCYQHWAEERVVDPSLLADPHVLPVYVPLPLGDYGTWLSDDSPRYWEIEAKGEAPGIDFLARFLLPVYARQ